MSLDITVNTTLGDFTLEASAKLDGPLSVLVGPSGSGKSTLLNVIAGLTRPHTGKVMFGDEVWFDSDRNLFVPPHLRRIGYVFQEGRLLPHLSVRSNLTYSRWFRRSTGPAPELDEIVDLLDIGHLLDRSPRNLSGGERQRSALARALLATPSLLLMDEPLAALDEARRDEVLPYIENVRDRYRIPIVYVTHASEEAERLGDEIVSIRQGRIEKIERRVRG
ncbi:MAG: modC [Hyphomicrobiales bacterium]|nr:modC [Hyphomicrobiales bacterium]